jgi:hypothetical protein
LELMVCGQVSDRHHLKLFSWTLKLVPAEARKDDRRTITDEVYEKAKVLIKP